MKCAICKKEITTATGSIYKLGEHVHIVCYTKMEKELNKAIAGGQLNVKDD